MEEGERLSKKQLAQESAIKKLRAGAKEAAEQKAALEAALASERARLQDALAARAATDEARQVTPRHGMDLCMRSIECRCGPRAEQVKLATTAAAGLIAPVQSCAGVLQATEQRHQGALQQERSLHQQQLARARAAQVGRHRARDLSRPVVAVRAFVSCNSTHLTPPVGSGSVCSSTGGCGAEGGGSGAGGRRPAAAGGRGPGGRRRGGGRGAAHHPGAPAGRLRPSVRFFQLSRRIVGCKICASAHRWFRLRQTGVPWA
jgi:hypothetical protein